MRYVGVDLYKQTISLCVVELVGRERKVVQRKRFRCADEDALLAYFAGLGLYEAVVEATASYEWFVQLIEPTAARIVLADRITSAKNKLRWIVSNYNADRTDLFSRAGRAYLKKIDLPAPIGSPPTCCAKNSTSTRRASRRSTSG